MRNRKLIFFVAGMLCLGWAHLQAQTAFIHIQQTFYENSFAAFDSIQFQFNSCQFSGNDTTRHVFKLNRAMDTCMAVVGKDTLKFLARFRENTEYVIMPGCCCAAFTIQPVTEAKRGTVTFSNRSRKDMGLVLCGIETDTVKAGQKQTEFAAESAMCLFKPCAIDIVKPQYYDPKYHYSVSEDKNYDSLWTEQQTYVVESFSFLFLHGEDVEIITDYSGTKFILVVRNRRPR